MKRIVLLGVLFGFAVLASGCGGGGATVEKPDKPAAPPKPGEIKEY